MVKDHKKVVAEFKREASQGQDSELKNWASTTLPELQQHLQMAETLAQRY
jgi:putative membrane protein